MGHTNSLEFTGPETVNGYAASLIVGPVTAFSYPELTQDEEYAHLLMGNPSKATEDATKKDNYLMKKKYFALSYNNNNGSPNWVSWRLTKDDLGVAKRKQTFDTDKTLPKGFKQITTKEYAGSGFDRGHMCPHSDRGKDLESSFATFVMTNIIPQAPQVNRQAWELLEDYCRDLVSNHNKRLYIVCGPAGKGGTNEHGEFKTSLSDGRILVPARCWKVILVVDEGDGSDLDRVNKDGARLIGVLMPNDDTVKFDWAKFRQPVKQIEEVTGLRFFDKVDATVIDDLKQDKDRVLIQPQTPKFKVN